MPRESEENTGRRPGGDIQPEREREVTKGRYLFFPFTLLSWIL